MCNLKALRKQLLSKDGDISLKAAYKLASIGGDKVLDILIPLLRNKDPYIRDAAAISLRDIKNNNKALPYLVKALKDPKNRNNRGTLMSALITMDCSRLLLMLIDLALHGIYEVQSKALMILEKQSFSTSLPEIKKAREMISCYRKSRKKCADYKILIEEIEEYLTRIQKRTA